MRLEASKERKMDKWQRNLWAVVLILVAVLTRWLPHEANFTPVLAVALFAGGRFSKRWLSALLVIGAMALSDWFLGFHSTLVMVYVSLIAITFMGAGLKASRLGWLRLGGMAGAASVLFYV